MTRALRTFMMPALAALALLARPAHAESRTMPVQLEALNPEVAAHPYRLDDGPMVFQNKISFSPAYGSLGSHRLFSFRLGYSPNRWLAYEATIGHNPGQSVHAVLHTFTAIVRHPLAGRFQPYLTAGYGMMMVFPGEALNADPVTKNALIAGGGLELFLRNDLAVRGDLRDATVFGHDADQTSGVALHYAQMTIGLSFYRTVRP
jgi:hypothetical protein